MPDVRESYYIACSKLADYGLTLRIRLYNLIQFAQTTQTTQTTQSFQTSQTSHLNTTLKPYAVRIYA
jgi:hypothetical protein